MHASLQPLLTHWSLVYLHEIFRQVIFKLIVVIDGRDISYEIDLKWMSLGLTDDKAILVQVMT